MAYNSLVPTTGHTPAQDYTTIQGNFAQISASYDTDHVALSGGTPQGFHKQVSLSTYGSAGAVSGAQSYAFSSNASAAGSQLVYQPSVVAFSLPVSCQVLGRITWNGGAWVNGAGTSFNLNTNSGVIASPAVTFTSALANNTYFTSLLYESPSPVGVLSIGSRTTSGFVINLDQTNASVSSGDSIVIMVY